MQTLLSVKELYKNFPVYSGFFSKPTSYVHALNDVNFNLYKGEVLGIAGESGCVKTTLGRCILKLEEPTSGEISFNGVNIFDANKKTIKDFRTQAQIIFQNPYASLNPKMTVYETLKEPLMINGAAGAGRARKPNKTAVNERVEEVIELVGMKKSDLKRYPHEFSGGQRQRIAIARALMLKPDFIVADEPVSALDVSIQAQIINLLLELKQKLNLTIIFISHDLSVIRHISDRVAVMYLGEIVEIGTTKEIFDTPKHPYTKALLAAIPTIEHKQKNMNLIKDNLPSPTEIPFGCKFGDRCPYVTDICVAGGIKEKQFSDTHFSKCYLG